MTRESHRNGGEDPAPRGGVVRAILPALLMLVLLGAMIAGGIARNRARAQDAVEQHSGRSKVATYADHAGRWLESRQDPAGAWSCGGSRSSEVTARVLLNLASAGRSNRPSFVAGLAWLRGEAEDPAGIQDPKSAFVIRSALEIGSPASHRQEGAPEPVAGGRGATGGAGEGGDRWLDRAYLALLAGGASGSPPAEALLAELEAGAGEPPWPKRGTLDLATLVRLKASACLAARDRCHDLDAAAGDLISRMSPEGRFTSGGAPAEGCRGGEEEVGSAAMAAITIYGEILKLRAALVRPTTEP